MNRRKAKLLSFSITLCFLLIHIGLYILFRHYGVRPMAWFNIFSILFYIGMFVVIQLSLYRTFSISIYMEVVVHMSLAVYFTGWEAGFQNTLIGISFIMTYSEYIQRYLKVRYVKSTPICLIGMIAYLVSFVVSHYHVAPYPLPDDVNYMLQIFWGVAVFSISIVFLHTFVNLTSRSEEMLSNEVGHDQLTHLPNRYFMTDHLNDLEQDHKLAGHWIAMVDIDDFKKINDTRGHNCGDFILKEVSAILRTSDIKMSVCRWGGEEFLLLGTVTQDLDRCYMKLDDLREEILYHSFIYEGTNVWLTVTIGLAEYQPGTSISDWINTADQRMYEGKQNGKNQVVM